MTDLVVTGLGLVLPCGDGVEAARASLASGAACFAELPAELGEGRGAICSEFNPVGTIPPMQLRRLDRCSRFAWVAAAQAFSDAGLDPGSGIGDRTAIAAATMTGGSEASEAFLRPYYERGPAGASPLVFPNCVANAAAGHLALAFGLKGPSTTQLEREASGFAALDQASRWLRMGFCDVALVVGLDGLFPMLGTVCGAAGLLARQGNPEADSGRGFLCGEGAAALVLERSDDALARGARPRARLGALTQRAAARPSDRASALADAVAEACPHPPQRWIGGANGHPQLDRLEAALRESKSAWLAPLHPKLLWGEFGGSGAQLLAAGLLEPADSVLVSGPSSFGGQWALRWDEVQG
ncbi:MAG TPA: beta-ketoacyl synthase N-terminal-like domain-containing protein [Holophagaceae bacterium]|nr:beta-ketoacyl synthase N-terminal-like domain-containing protein [Holophagaceae bacterium]